MKLQKGAPRENQLGKKTEKHSLLHRGKKPKDRIGKQKKIDITGRSILNEEVTEESLQG